MTEVIESEYGTTVRDAAYFGSPKDLSFQLGIVDFATEQIGHISRAVQSVSVSYSMDMSPQVTVQLFDVNMQMLANNYFNVGRAFVYKTERRVQLPNEAILENAAANSTTTNTSVSAPSANSLADVEFGYKRFFYEVASLSVGPGAGSSPSITLELRSRPIMQMKRDRNPGAIKETSPEIFVQEAASKYGLDFYVEKPSKTKVKINKASNDKRADSTWDVLDGLASEAKFSLFESDGVLFYTSMRHLFGLWGPEQMTAFVVDEKTNQLVMRDMNSWYVEWPSIGQYGGESDEVEVGGVTQVLKYARLLTPMQIPTFRRSDSDIYQVEGSMSLDRHNAMVLRPGMTVYIAGVPTFDDFYIITDVSFEHMSTNPVQVSFRKPEREDKYITDIPIGPFGDYALMDVVN